MGFLDVMLGSRNDPTLLPGMDESIADVSGMKFRLPKYLKAAKKALNTGSDLSNLGVFAPFKQAEAADLSDIDAEAGYGANALYGQAGGDQAIAMRALTDRAKEHRREQTGRQYVDAAAGLRGEVTDALRNKDAGEMWRQEMLSRLRSNVYDRSRRGGGLLGDIVRGGAQVASAFAMPGTCWIARALWGETDPRAELVRFWLMVQAEKSAFWALFLTLYALVGERVAKRVKRGGMVRRMASVLFERILNLAMQTEALA